MTGRKKVRCSNFNNSFGRREVISGQGSSENVSRSVNWICDLHIYTYLSVQLFIHTSVTFSTISVYENVARRILFVCIVLVTNLPSRPFSLSPLSAVCAQVPGDHVHFRARLHPARGRHLPAGAAHVHQWHRLRARLPTQRYVLRNCIKTWQFDGAVSRMVTNSITCHPEKLFTAPAKSIHNNNSLMKTLYEEEGWKCETL